MIAPMLLIPFVKPKPSERSRGGKIVAIVLIPLGVPIASVAPSATRHRMNWVNPLAQPCSIADTLQAATPTGFAHFTPSRSTIAPVNRKAMAAAP